MTVFEIIGWVSGVISIIALLVAGVIASRCESVFDSTDEDEMNIDEDEMNILNLIFFLR